MARNTDAEIKAMFDQTTAKLPPRGRKKAADPAQTSTERSTAAPVAVTAADAAAGTPESSPEAAVAAGPAQAAARPSADAGEGAPEPKATSSAASTIRVTTSVPEDVWLMVGDFCRSTGQTRTTVIVFALGSTRERHRELILAERGQDGLQPSDAEALAMFGLDQPPPPRGRSRAKKQLPYYPTAQMNEVLDQMVKDAGAATRSELISAALRAYLSDK